jgi:hypothetical protein
MLTPSELIINELHMIYSQVIDLDLCHEESRIYLGYHPHNEGMCLGCFPWDILSGKNNNQLKLILKNKKQKQK